MSPDLHPTKVTIMARSTHPTAEPHSSLQFVEFTRYLPIHSANLATNGNIDFVSSSSSTNFLFRSTNLKFKPQASLSSFSPRPHVPKLFWVSLPMPKPMGCAREMRSPARFRDDPSSFACLCLFSKSFHLAWYLRLCFF